MKKYTFILIIIFASWLKGQSSQNDYNIIPKPNFITPQEGQFVLDSEVCLVTDSALEKTAAQLKAFIKQGINQSFSGTRCEKTIELRVNNEYSPESYSIDISNNNLLIESADNQGAFYALQTVRQMLPISFEKNEPLVKVAIPNVKIFDAPRYHHRAMMLDVARHFFTIDDVKKVLDGMALYKMNVLHLHLSDDQGWRIEIKSWPKLTEIGGKASVRNEKAGYYTQDGYKEIQDYAKKMHITIIPEIDMPGHTNAALSSYAELNCNNVATNPYYAMRVGFSSLCIDKDVTYEFLNDVISEMAAMTIGDYIHIGGDEAQSTKKEDYIAFMNKVQGIVENYGKKSIGWDELAHASLNKNTQLQYWSKKDNALLGVYKRAKIIFSPAKYIYLDMKYNESTKLGLKWAGYNSVKDAYEWDPLTEITSITDDQVAGVESPLWSETIKTINDLEFLMYPRVIGVAEIGWSKKEDRNWNDYKNRLARQQSRLESLGINFYKSPLVNWQ